MPLANVNGINLYYESFGEGVPLICVCGFAETHSIWQNYIPSFSKHFQLILFDNRGAGQTDAPIEGYSIELLALDVVSLMDHLQLESAHFIGNSMGTLIIQQLCIEYPTRVNKVVLCAPFAHLPPITKHQIQSQMKLLLRGIDRKLLLEINANWLLSNKFIENSDHLEQLLKDVLSDPYQQTMEGLLGQIHALFDADLRKKVHEIPHDILLLAGEKDISTPLYCAQYLKERLPNSSLHVFKEMGHRFHYEIPGQVIKHTTDFLLQG